MRKFAYLLVGVVALVAIAVTATLFVVGYFTPTSSVGEPSAPVESNAISQPAIGAPIASGNYGMGGGGAVGREAAAYDVAMPVPTFSQTTFRLQATLPETVPSAIVWQQGVPAAWSEAEMAAIAVALGFDGTLYREQMQGVVEASVSSVSVSEPAVVSGVMPAFGDAPFVAIDGVRRLTFYAGGFSYSNPNADPMRSGQPPLAFDQALPLAEAFLRSTGLLDDGYQARRGWGDEVQFLRQIDGLWLERQFALVTVGGNGEIMWADYSNLANLQQADSGLPTIDAQRAYELLTANADQYGYMYLPSDAQRARDRAQAVQVMSYMRTYAPGQTARLNTWLQVLQPVAGGTPLILADNVRIVADEALLAELSANGYTSVQLSGRFGGTPEALTFEVASWTANVVNMDQRLSGTLRRDGERAVLVVSGGLQIELPGAPAALADGTDIAVYGYSISAAQEGALPQFDWISIETLVTMQPEPLEPPAGPYTSSELTVTAVDLVLNSTYVSETLFGSSEYAGEQYAQAWRFTTVNEAGDTLIFFVPAIEQSNG